MLIDNEFPAYDDARTYKHLLYKYGIIIRQAGQSRRPYDAPAPYVAVSLNQPHVARTQIAFRMLIFDNQPMFISSKILRARPKPVLA